LPIESAAYIADLNAANPPDADPVGQADDHIRLIKGVLKATFPNLTGPVTANQDKLNGGLPAGIITYWYGSSGSVPTGWALCNGQTVLRSDGSGNITTPNLSDTFIRCAAGGTVVAGATGGAATHSHALTVAGHALTTGELPAHNHPVTDPGHNHPVTDPGHTHAYNAGASQNTLTGTVGVNLFTAQTGAVSASSTTGISVGNNATGITVGNTGSGTAHGHTGSTSDSQSNIPPFIGLVPIMKV
jgi:hypothetical protein